RAGVGEHVAESDRWGHGRAGLRQRRLQQFHRGSGASRHSAWIRGSQPSQTNASSTHAIMKPPTTMHRNAISAAIASDARVESGSADGIGEKHRFRTRVRARRLPRHHDGGRRRSKNGLQGRPPSLPKDADDFSDSTLYRMPTAASPAFDATAPAALTGSST